MHPKDRLGRMKSSDGVTDKQHGVPDGSRSRRTDSSQRWGRGAATALERMKDLERRHGATPDKPSQSEREQRDE